MTNDLVPYNPKSEFSEEEQTKARRIRLIIWVILILIFVVLTFGWFYWNGQKRKVEERERKKLRLAEIEASIRYLEAQKRKIEKREKIIKICVRIGIGILLVITNYIYDRNYILSVDFDTVIGKLLNLNACIITGYSFFAFISYGSIDNFVRRLKIILAGILRKNHLDSLAELELLIKEREVLKKELETLENEASFNTVV